MTDQEIKELTQKFNTIQEISQAISRTDQKIVHYTKILECFKLHSRYTDNTGSLEFKVKNNDTLYDNHGTNVADDYLTASIPLTNNQCIDYLNNQLDKLNSIKQEHITKLRNL